MRNTFIITILICLMSCAEMHDPILHGGGSIQFIPECNHEIDSVIIQRMTDCFEYDWEPGIFCKHLNDYHVEWSNPYKKYEIDFIDQSDYIRSDYGDYKTVWYTNAYNNNKVVNGFIYTDHSNDTICRPPDFVFSSTCNICIKESIHDYTQNNGKYLQLFREKLFQRSFLYVIQVKLINNNKRAINAGTFLITGQAERFDLLAEQNCGNICHTFSPQFKDDIIVGSFMSFGLPNCNPYEFRYNYRRNIIKDSDILIQNNLYIQLIYKTSRAIIKCDVSDQIRLQPTGGLILLEIDMNDYPEPGSEMTDPFDVFVNDYENVDQYYNNI